MAISLYIMIIVLISTIAVFGTASYTNPNLPFIPSFISNYTSKCFSDSDCEWKITNCCSENAGGYWECVNKRAYKPKLDCSKMTVLCAQIISPKPSKLCVCEQGSCVIK